MEEEGSCSWVRRAKYSHTLYQRSNSSRETCTPFVSVKSDASSDSKLKFKSLSLEPKSESLDYVDALSIPLPSKGGDDAEPWNSQIQSKKSFINTESLVSSTSLLNYSAVSTSSGPNLSFESSFDSPSKRKAKPPPPPSLIPPATFSFFPDGSKLSSKWSDSSTVPTPSLRLPTPKARTELIHDSDKPAMPTTRKEMNSKPKRRSLSPLPTTILSDVFKEAKSIGKRFSTPPPSRKSTSRVAASRSSAELSPMKHLSDLRAGDKSRGNKELGSWSKYFDHTSGRVTSVEIGEEWRVDLSKLYLGMRFACGAHSKLYHGMYNDRPVAVKIVRQPEDEEDEESEALAARLAKQFYREVTFLSQLTHPNVIKLIGACKNPPVFCIIAEFLSGGSLRAFLHKLEHKSLPLQKLVSISLQIARGMEYIHSQGIIHRDLKPENIIFDQDFRVKIVDFGIACEEAYCDAVAEEPGTYRWMAPEMIKHKPYGRKVDVYSFGLILWEMVTGSIPYEDMTPIQAAFAVVNKNSRPVIPTDCPAPLRALIEQCWASHIEKRPEFWQIVKVLEHFELALARDGTLNQLQNLTFHDHKNRLLHWIQKLKPSLADGTGALAPKLL